MDGKRMDAGVLASSKGKINILYLTSYGDKLGGGERSFIGLLKTLDKERFTPHAIILSDGKLKEDMKNIGLKVTTIALSKRILDMSSDRGGIKIIGAALSLWSVFTVVIKLCRYVRKNKISLIHTQCFKSSMLGAIVSFISRIPVVRHERTLIRHGVLDKFFLPFTASVIAISDAVKNKFSGMNLNGKVRRIHNGIDLDEFRPGLPTQFRKELKVAKDVHLVCMVGQLIPWKGHRYFIEAAKGVIKIRQDARFVIVGDTPPFADDCYARELKSFTSALGISDYVIFTGGRDDVNNILSSTDIVVLTSLAEPFGRALIEAMALGKPVIATNGGGAPEIVEDKKTGILIPPADSRTLTDAILKLMDDKEVAIKMGICGRKRAEERFGLEKNARETENLYLEILRSGNNRA